MQIVPVARVLALSLSALLLTASCTSHGGCDGRWRADDATLALARERTTTMRGDGLPGGILVGIAERGRLEIVGGHARISFIGEDAPDGADYAVVQPALGQLQLTATAEHRDLPTTLTLHCVSPNADPCTSLRLFAFDDTVLPDAPPITLARGE